MVRLTIDLPEDSFAALRQDPAMLTRELRLAAAVKWYESRMISQERAAEIAGLSRSEFVAALARWNVSPFQYEPGELENELQSL